VEASGLATLLALAIGGKPDVIARWIGAAKAVLSILLLETLVFLSIPGSQLIGRAMTRPRRKSTKASVNARPRKSVPGVKLVKQQAAQLRHLRNMTGELRA